MEEDEEVESEAVIRDEAELISRMNPVRVISPPVMIPTGLEEENVSSTSSLFHANASVLTAPSALPFPPTFPHGIQPVPSTSSASFVPSSLPMDISSLPPDLASNLPVPSDGVTSESEAEHPRLLEVDISETSEGSEVPLQFSEIQGISKHSLFKPQNLGRNVRYRQICQTYSVCYRKCKKGYHLPERKIFF